MRLVPSIEIALALSLLFLLVISGLNSLQSPYTEAVGCRADWQAAIDAREQGTAEFSRGCSQFYFPDTEPAVPADFYEIRDEWDDKATVYLDEVGSEFPQTILSVIAGYPGIWLAWFAGAFATGPLQGQRAAAFIVGMGVRRSRLYRGGVALGLTVLASLLVFLTIGSATWALITLDIEPNAGAMTWLSNLALTSPGLLAFFAGGAAAGSLVGRTGRAMMVLPIVLLIEGFADSLVGGARVLPSQLHATILAHMSNIQPFWLPSTYEMTHTAAAVSLTAWAVVLSIVGLQYTSTMRIQTVDEVVLPRRI